MLPKLLLVALVFVVVVVPDPVELVSTFSDFRSTIDDPFKINWRIDSFANDSDLIDDRESRYFERRPRYPCPSLRFSLANGMVRLRGNGKMVRFSCNSGFELSGSRFATCIRGRWNRQLPVCVSSGCSPISDQPPLKVKNAASFNHSVLDLECELGYALVINVIRPVRYPGGAALPKTTDPDWLTSDTPSDGMRTKTSSISHNPYERIRVYCVGSTWHMDDSTNRDFSGLSDKIPILHPQCAIYEEPVNKSMKCSFETDLCGWFQDSDDNFDWLRNHHTTPSFLDATGPSYDHTLGVNNSGYYLYLESSYPRGPGDKARLYSPVYEHRDVPQPPVACFEFWYNMHGRAIGSLKVLVKEKEQQIGEITPKWELVGDQGDEWTRIQLEIRPSAPNMTRPFQIIFEGVIGEGHQGDIGIDDFSLKLGQKCNNLNESEPGLLTPIDAWTNDNTTDDSMTADEGNSFGNSSSTTTDLPPNYRLLSEVAKGWLIKAFKSKLNQNSTTTTTLKPASSTTITAKFGSFDDLHEKLKVATEKQIQKYNELRNATRTPLPTTLTTPIPPTTSLLEQKSNVSEISSNEVSPPKADLLNSTATSKENITGSKHGHFYSFLTIIFVATIIVVLVYSTYANRAPLANPEAVASGAGINTVVATFVRRCKMLRSPTSFRRQGQHDDGEMLIIGGDGGADDETMMPNSSSINAGRENSEFVYDNFNDSAVFLQPSNRVNLL